MDNRWILRAAAFLFAVGLVALLAWLTDTGEADTCADSQADVSAAVLADGQENQEGMINRAILVQGECEE